MKKILFAVLLAVMITTPALGALTQDEVAESKALWTNDKPALDERINAPTHTQAEISAIIEETNRMINRVNYFIENADNDKQKAVLKDRLSILKDMLAQAQEIAPTEAEPIDETVNEETKNEEAPPADCDCDCAEKMEESAAVEEAGDAAKMEASMEAAKEKMGGLIRQAPNRDSRDSEESWQAPIVNQTTINITVNVNYTNSREEIALPPTLPALPPVFQPERRLGVWARVA